MFIWILLVITAALSIATTTFIIQKKITNKKTKQQTNKISISQQIPADLTTIQLTPEDKKEAKEDNALYKKPSEIVHEDGLLNRIFIEIKSLKDHQLLSEIQINDLEYEEIIKYSIKKIKNEKTLSLQNPDEIIAITLVQVGIREYQEGNYWDMFNKKTELNLSTIQRCYIGYSVLETLKKYKLVVDDSSIKRNNYVQSILMHSFIPLKYLDDFFKFIFAYYENSLHHKLPEDFDDEFDSLASYMMLSLEEKDDTIEIESKSGVKSEYKLLKSTRKVLSNKKITSSRKIIKQLLIWIDGYYWENFIPEEEPIFLIYNSFIKWLKIHDSKPDSERKIKKYSASFTRLAIQEPYLQWDFENSYLLLEIPQRKIREQDFNGSLRAIFNHASESFCYELETYKNLGVVYSEEKTIPIMKNFFVPFSINITSNKEDLYNFQNLSYFIFNKDYIQQKSLKIGLNYLLIAKSALINFPDPEIVLEKIEYDEGLLYSLQVNEKTIIYIDNIPISLAGEFKEEVLYDPIENVIFTEKSSSTYPITKKHPTIYTKILNQYKDEFILEVNGKKRFRKNLNNFITEIIIPNDFNNIGLCFLMDEILPQEEAIYEISIRLNGKKKLLCKYLLIHDLEVKTDKQIYILKEKAQVTVLSNTEIEPVNATEIIDQSNFTVSLQEDFFQFYIKLKDKILLSTPLIKLKWSFNNRVHCTPRAG